MNDTEQPSEALLSLATAADIVTEWQDYTGRTRKVAVPSLQAILDAFGLPANSDQECRESLVQVQETKRRLPPLITAQVDEQIKLPVGFAAEGESQGDAGERWAINGELCDEAGDRAPVRLERQADGMLTLNSINRPGYYTLEAGKCRQIKLAVAPRRCCSMGELTGQRRSFGLAAQIYSLRRRGDGGSGDYTALKQFARASAEAGAQAVAISPVHALFLADETRYSPYSPSSRLFLNVLYIDPYAVLDEQLVRSCLVGSGLEERMQALENESLINWRGIFETRIALLRCVWEELGPGLLQATDAAGREFQQFRNSQGRALEQHAIFECLHRHHFLANSEHWHWRTWPEGFQDPDSVEVRRFAEEHANEVGFHTFLQWLAARGLAEAHSAGREAGLGIGLIADLAIGTDSGGSHTWSRQEDMLAGLSVGAPPDLLSHEGQDWGLTTFSPHALRAHGYEPFLELLRASLRHAGGLRIDHILGFRRLWLVPEGRKASDGAYLKFPQTDLLNLIALESWRHRAVIIGEDLGTVPEGFRDQISAAGIYGMQVLWFEQEHGLYTDPSRWRDDTMATTSTHDLATVAGWWKGDDLKWKQELNRLPPDSSIQQEAELRDDSRRALWAAFRHARVADGEQPEVEASRKAVDSAVAFVASTPAPLALIPVEDILGLREQPNLPGTIDEHPNWRRRLPVRTDVLLLQQEAAARLEALRRLRSAHESEP